MERTSERRAVGLVVAAVLGAIVAGALALTTVRDIRTSLDDAAELRSADLALSAHDTAATSISRAVILAESERAGAAGAEDVAAAVDSAVDDIARVANHLDELSTGDLEPLLDAWVKAANGALGEVDAGNTEAAVASLRDAADPAGDAFTAALVEERNDLADRVADSDSSVRWFGRVAGFLVVFLLPAAAILVYRVSARRQLFTAIAHLDARVEAEKAAATRTDSADVADTLEAAAPETAEAAAAEPEPDEIAEEAELKVVFDAEVDEVAQATSIVFAPAAEVVAENEPVEQPEAAEPEPDLEPDPVVEQERGEVQAAESETQPEPDAEPELVSVADGGAEAEVEPEREEVPAAEAGTDAEPEADATVEPVPSQAQAGGTEAEPETEPDAVPELVSVADGGSEDLDAWDEPVAEFDVEDQVELGEELTDEASLDEVADTVFADALADAAADTDIEPDRDLVPLEMRDQIDAVISSFVAAGEPVGGTYGEGIVVADPAKVDRVLDNLITNALQHGGTDVRILGDAAGSNYVVAIEDDGDGLPEPVADAFNAGDPIDGSPETGLAATRALVNEIGGSLDYERMPGRTSFVLWLPLTWDSDLVGADER